MGRRGSREGLGFSLRHWQAGVCTIILLFQYPQHHQTSRKRSTFLPLSSAALGAFSILILASLLTESHRKLTATAQKTWTVLSSAHPNSLIFISKIYSASVIYFFKSSWEKGQDSDCQNSPSTSSLLSGKRYNNWQEPRFRIRWHSVTISLNWMYLSSKKKHQQIPDAECNYVWMAECFILFSIGEKKSHH